MSGKKRRIEDGRPRKEVLGRRRHSRSCPEMKISAKFDESVDLAIRLGVDPKHADQMVRGAVNLPHGTARRSAWSCSPRATRPRRRRRPAPTRWAPRTSSRGSRKENWLDFDSAVSTPGPHGTGRPARSRARSARPDAEPEGRYRDLRRRQGGSRTQGRSRRVQGREGGMVHARIGKISFGAEKLRENAWALLELIQKLKPSTRRAPT